mgnify:CR=1 FL=1
MKPVSLLRRMVPLTLALLLLAGCAAGDPAASAPGGSTSDPAQGAASSTPTGLEQPFVFTRDNLPRLDGSTSTVPLGQAIASVLLGESREERMEKVRSALAQVGLPEYLLSRYPHQISGGEGQRLVICRALLLEPEVLLLDEPTSMLDVSVQASVMNLLKELQQRLGLTYLYITHDIELLGWISHTIGVMQKGRLVEVGPREQIMEAPAHPYTKELLYAYRHWE